MKTKPLAIVAIVVFLLFVWMIEANAGERQVEEAILFIVTKGIPEHRIKPWKKHPLTRDSKARAELVQAIVQAAHDHDIPEMLLVSIAFRENSFTPGTGSIGEVSVFQIIPDNQRSIRKGLFPWTTYSEPRCDLSTVDGSAMCAAALLWIHRARCGDLPGAMMLYATGRTCKPDTPKLRWIQNDRFGVMEILEKRFPND
jgi:hypothetical protein